jgi:PAS domain S-box-containing protein
VKLFPKETVVQGDLTRRSSLCLCLLVTVFFVWFCGAMEAAAADAPAGEAPVLNKRALILVSAAFGATATDRYVTGLLNGLRNGGVRSGSISIEYLNLARHMNRAHRQALVTLLTTRYSNVQFDVVFCVQQPALDFLLNDVPALAPQATVFGWTAQLPIGANTGDRQFVFQSTRLDYRGTLERALELFPSTERVIVMQGNSEVELSRWENIREDLAPWKDKLAIEDTQALSADEIEARLATPPKNAIVMGIGITRDAKGQIFVPPEFIARIVRTSKAPYFVVVDLGVEYGAIGGMVTRIGDDAAALSGMAVDVLRGTAKLKEQVTLVPNIKTPVFSWPQLKRWGRDPDVLPPNTVFVNRPLTLWGQYRNYVIASVLVLSLLVLLIVIMIWQNRRLSTMANALRKSEKGARAITQSAHDAVVTSENAGNIAGWNHSAETIFGYTESEVMGQPLTLLMPERYRDGHLAGINRIRTGGEHHIIGKAVELNGLRKDGSEFPLELSLAEWETTDGWFITGIIRDITERKRDERLLRMEHAISRSLAEADDVSSTLKQVMRIICEANKWGVAIYWRVDETAGVLRFGEFWNAPESNLGPYTEASREATFAPGIGLVGRVWQSGKPIWVANFSSDPRVVQKVLARELGMQGALMFPVISEGQTLGVFAFLGLTLREPDERLLAATRVIGNEVGQLLRRKRTEAELLESEARFRGMAEMSSDFYWETDSEHRISLRSAGNEGSSLMVMAHGSPFGARRWDIPYISPNEAGWEAHRAVLAEHLPIRNFEFSRLGKDGSERHISINGEPVVDAAGDFRGYRGVGSDITERKRHGVELQRLNEELDQRVQQRTQELQVANSELEAFSYSVSHDLRAPLRAIHGFSSLVEKQYAEQIDEQGRDMLRRVGAGVNKMGALIDDLLRLSRISRQEMRIRSVDLSALAWEVVGELQDGAPERKIEWVIAPQLSAQGDPGLLRVALQNLIGNAWKYSSKREGPRIEFGVSERHGQQAYFVRDNGAGFDMAYANKLFGAFQRLHSPGEFPGTGIGLATVKRIVQRHGGEVGAESKLGEGATFYFTL